MIRATPENMAMLIDLIVNGVEDVEPRDPTDQEIADMLNSWAEGEA